MIRKQIALFASGVLYPYPYVPFREKVGLIAYADIEGPDQTAHAV